MALEEELYTYDDEFKGSLSTVDAEGKRIWVYPKKPKGKFHNARAYVSIVLLTILFSGPFIKINGNPFLLLNIFEGKFIILGVPFWPQDFFLFALAFVLFFVVVIIFTVAFGRLWCGWACPQTLFMEMVFRKIEYWIEGDANHQRKLNAAPWTTEKIIKKGSKQLIFLIFSILISHTAMAYLIGLEQVKEIVQQPPSSNPSGFIGLVVFTGIFYWVFAYFREQACTVVCPYGRLQGVLVVKDTIAVMYDWVRGEPRGKIKKNAVDAAKGDCIDCKLCVHVCPTGIDIRNGTQLECVNCTACIDACDDVMLKINKPTGLIRMDSHNGIVNKTKKIFTPRVIAYSVVMLVLTTFLSFLLMTREEIEVTFLKKPGTSYQISNDAVISNIFDVKIYNKTFAPVPFDLKIGNIEGAEIVSITDGEAIVQDDSMYSGMYLLKVPKSKLTGDVTVLEIEVYTEGKVLEVLKINFMGPMVY